MIFPGTSVDRSQQLNELRHRAVAYRSSAVVLELSGRVTDADDYRRQAAALDDQISALKSTIQ